MNLIMEMTEYRNRLVSDLENEHKRFKAMSNYSHAQANKYAEVADAMKAAAEALKRDEAVRLGDLAVNLNGPR